MINLYIKENPCKRLILYCKFSRINIIKYENNTELVYPCFFAKNNIIFIKNIFKKINKFKNINLPLIISYNRNNFNDFDIEIKKIKFTDLLNSKKIDISCIYFNKEFSNIKNVFSYEIFKNFFITNKTLAIPVKIDENTEFSQILPNTFNKYAIFNNINKYEYNIIKSKLFLTDIDWISYFKKNINNEEFTIFVILNNNLSMIPLIKNNSNFYKIIIYKLDYELYNNIPKNKYILCNKFYILLKVLKLYGLNSKIVFINNYISNIKLKKILNLESNFYNDDDCILFRSYQLYLIKFYDKRIDYNYLEFLYKYLINLNSTKKVMLINDSIMKKCYNKSLFYLVDDIIEILYKHKHLDSEYYFTKKLSILFYTRKLGNLKKIKLKKEDMKNTKIEMIPLLWLTSKYFNLEQECLNDIIKKNSDLIIKSYKLMETLEIKKYEIFTDDLIAENIIKHLNQNLNPKIKEICTNILLFNVDYIKNNLNFNKIYNCDLDEILRNKLIKKNFLKYGFSLFSFHSHVPQFVNSMENILKIRELSLNFYIELNKKIDDSVKVKIKKDIEKYNIFEFANITTNFPFSYHGENSKDLFINRNKIVELYLKSKFKNTNMEYNSFKKNIKKKIGFLSNFLTRKHSVFKDRHQVIKGLSELNEFDVYVFTFDDFLPCVRDNFKKCKHIKLLSNYEKDISNIRNLNLDMLVFCEIGMDLRAYYMAFNRLSKIQVNTWGHSDTSGLPKIDYFISSKYYENESSQQNYSEKLVLLDSLSTSYVNPSKNLKLNKKIYNYSLFGNQKIVLCNQSLFKILPIFDNYLIDILKKNRNIIIVLLDIKNLRMKFMERIANKCTELQILNRIKIIDHGYKHDEFLNLVKLSYIQLDVFPFGGCNSSLECLEQGIPVVTQESNMLNGRFTSGFYKKIDLLEMITKNKENYIKIVNKLLNNTEFYNKIVSKINKNNSKLFMEKKSIDTWYNFISEKLYTSLH